MAVCSKELNVQIDWRNALSEMVERLEVKKPYVFTNGDGSPIRTALIGDYEAWEYNVGLRLTGSERRWMERGK
jgi:hypothetical protein